jgi:CubicO group peptidase (beta-lactamase class C family)
VSKTVFAYAVLKLCDQGVLDLDAPLTKYTPEHLLDDPRLDLITTRRVLCHTTGLPDWRSDKEPMKIGFTPGEKWSYSGEGYSYLQSVVTHLTGHVDPTDCSTFEQDLKVCATDIDRYMKTNLLVPFGMTSSGYVWTEAYDTLMALPHDEKGKVFSRRTTAPEAARYASAGDLHTTATEYAKFLIEVIDPKPADAFRLSAGIRAEMLRPQVQVMGGLWWGLGWAIERHDEGNVITHSGDNPGYKAFTAASVGRKSGYVILTNSDTGFEVIRKIVQSDGMQQFLPVTL